MLCSYWGIAESAVQFVLYEHFKKTMKASTTVRECTGMTLAPCAQSASFVFRFVAMGTRGLPTQLEHNGLNLLWT